MYNHTHVYQVGPEEGGWSIGRHEGLTMKNIESKTRSNKIEGIVA